MKFIRYIILTLIATLIVGCDALEYRGEPRFILYIQDSPADYKSLNVSVSAVEIFDDAQWIAIPHVKQSINLMQLTGGIMLRLSEGVVPDRTYTKIRVTFNTQGATLKNQTKEFPVIVPQESAVVTFEGQFPIGADVEYIALMDVQVAQSITESAEEGTFTFRPVARLIDLSVAGAISGTVVDQSNHTIAEAMLVRAIETSTRKVTTTFTNASTAQLFIRLDEGRYDLIITPDSLSKFEPDTLRDITVKMEQLTALGAIPLAPPKTD